jgi:hypothetical protein
MLLQRFNVTIQTFLDKGKDNSAFEGDATLKENEPIREAIESEQQYLQDNPVYYDVRFSFALCSVFLTPHLCPRSLD